MKNIVLTAAIALFLMACGAGAPTDDLGRKRAELDSLKGVYATTAERIKELDAWIAEHDSTVNRNLPVVKSFQLTPSVFEHYVDVHGNVRADKAADLYALAGGRVRTVNVEPGQRVHRGQMLITIDNDVVQKQLAQAETAKELATTMFEKQDRLWKQQIGSEMQYLQAKSQKEQAEASVAALHEQQRLTNVTAPFDGTVDDIMVRAGELAAPQMAIARVVDLTNVQLEADVSESYVKRINKDAPARVVFPSLGDTVEARIAHVGEFIDPANRTFKVTVVMPKNEGYMRPNLLSDISILDSRADSALVVPASAVLQDVEGKSYIFILDERKGDEGKALKVYVERVNEYKGSTHVRPAKAGTLAGGATVITDGAKNVSDGQAVRVAQN